MEPKDEKLYYTISEVAEKLQLSASLIRFWESEFTMLKVRKDRNGNRRFTQKDIELLQLIHHLVKERGYKLEGAKKKLTEEKHIAQKQFDALQSLEKVRLFLVDLRDRLAEEG